MYIFVQSIKKIFGRMTVLMISSLSDIKPTLTFCKYSISPSFFLNLIINIFINVQHMKVKI